LPIDPRGYKNHLKSHTEKEVPMLIFAEYFVSKVVQFFFGLFIVAMLAGAG
jgi:hypothetical protein